MSYTATLDPAPPLPGYRVVRLTSETSYLCLAPGDRYVILKPVDEDCLLTGGLHPSIKERLGRVRELAHAGVANLYSVERDAAGGAWLVWEYVGGNTLDDVLAARPTPRDLWIIVRELILAIEALHACGIVHGALHERNVLAEGTRHVRLTHVSPLLYTEIGDDESALLDMLERIAVAPHERLGEIAGDARSKPQPLRWVRSRLAGLIESRDVPTTSPVPEIEPTSRRTTLVAAVCVAIGGLAIAYGVKLYTSTPSVDATPPPQAVQR